MSKFADWSPASVFGSTVPRSTFPMATSTTCCLEGSLECRDMVSKTKTSPKKRDPTVNFVQRNDVVPKSNNSEQPKSNNSEQHDEEVKDKSRLLQRRNNNARVERKRNLAAVLLQRQVQVWLLRRQETMRLGEVRRLRESLQQAAASVIEASYGRYVKRRAISSYLHELGDFETRLDGLLQTCVRRKRQMEEVQRFATLRRRQTQAAEDQKRKVVFEWLSLYVRAKREKRELATARAREKVLGWVRRWMLRRRCEARAIAREKERRQEVHRHHSALAITAFFRVYKLRLEAKKMIQKRRNTRDGLTKLYGVFRVKVLRDAQGRWLARTRTIARADAAATTLQRVYRGHLAASRYARVVTSCLVLQRALRGHVARVHCAKVRQCKLQEARDHQRHAAATRIQRITRGRQTRLWFRDVLLKLRERFKCANCGVIEPSGTYCKYCGRHRTAFGSLSTVLLLHEKWRLGRPGSFRESTELMDIISASPISAVPLPTKATLSRSRSTSLASSTSGKFEILEPLTSLPVLLSPRHRRLIDRSNGGFTQPGNLQARRRNSISSISEQTAQRAAALADLQAKYTTSAQANVLELHVNRLQRATVAVNRGTRYYQESIL